MLTGIRHTTVLVVGLVLAGLFGRIFGAFKGIERD